MASKGKRPTDPMIVVSLTDGLAERNRLPLSHLIKVLKEVESMVNDVGSRILKERGMEDFRPDFGIEIVAEDGIAFHKGSVRAVIAITRHVEVGILAAGELISTTTALSMKRKGPAIETRRSDALSARIVSGLGRIALVNEAGKTRAAFEVTGPRSLFAVAHMAPIATRRAVLGDVAAENLRALRAPAFEESNVRLYGKLFRLKDKPLSDDSNSFWGELRRDNGETWRIEFKNRDLPLVTPLFTHQVLVIGDAVYYRGSSKKLVADKVELDEDRDIVGAYDKFFGVAKDVNPPAPRTM